MWNEISAPGPTRIAAPAPTAKPINDDELRTIVERLEATRNIFRENGELRTLLSEREAETKELRIRNTEMEEMLRNFAPLLVNAGTAMGLAVKGEKPETKIFT